MAAMKTIRRTRTRAAVAAVVVLAAIGTGAAYAATRASVRPIGNGVVVINTRLGYQGASAAGTGMVLTSSGRILTNNHVIAGATTIRVVVPAAKHAYTARVVGYDVKDDIAVLQLRGVSHLETVTIGSASALRLGARVTAVGNANGTGRVVSAGGRVTGLNRTITVQSDGRGPEQLSGLIETNAALRPGDSGGPLLNSAGRVVGVNTAASGNSPFTAAVNDGYAIPIGKATTLAQQIVAGRASARVHIGATAFLGVRLSGTEIVGVVPGGPAATAGLEPGDVISAVAGAAVSGPTGIQSVVLAHKPGQRVVVVYTDSNGFSHTTTVTLGSGPPQ